jgi:undecaprenyl-diphosphatase
MSLLQIIVLAIIQGVTEYLPVSSTGHLILAPALMGWTDQGFVTDMITNLGTLAATTIYFWRDVLSMFRGLLDLVRRQQTAASRLVLNVIIGTIPVLIFGLILDKTGIKDHLRSPMIVAIDFILWGIVLYVADSFGLMKNTVRDLTWRSALIIGGFQCLSLFPGTSRSGITMTGGRFLGFMRPEAARFSFLLSIPANLAASVFILKKAVDAGETIHSDQVICGILTFFIGLATIAFLMRIVRSWSFMPFVAYRIIFGAAILGLIFAGYPLGTVN